MRVTGAVSQLRTTNIEESIDFYTRVMGFELLFTYEDFYAGVKVGDSEFHLKLVDDPCPSIEFVRDGQHLHLYLAVEDALAYAKMLKSKKVTFLTEPHDTDYSTNDFTIQDNQEHVLGFGEVNS